MGIGVAILCVSVRLYTRNSTANQLKLQSLAFRCGVPNWILSPTRGSSSVPRRLPVSLDPNRSGDAPFQHRRTGAIPPTLAITKNGTLKPKDLVGMRRP
jgi:hypothetical protein